jgi:hypothetical protein
MMACNTECQHLPGQSANGLLDKPGTECGVVHPLAGCVSVCILFGSCICRLCPFFKKVLLKIVGELAEVMATAKYVSPRSRPKGVGEIR